MDFVIFYARRYNRSASDPKLETTIGAALRGRPLDGWGFGQAAPDAPSTLI